METFHIYPDDEEKSHDLEGYSCNCEPEITYHEEDDVIFVFHNSFDGREALEEAKRILGL